MWTNDTAPLMYGDGGLRRSAPWRRALKWRVLLRLARMRRPDPDLRFLSDHLRRDVGLEGASMREGRYRRFI